MNAERTNEMQTERLPVLMTGLDQAARDRRERLRAEARDEQATRKPRAGHGSPSRRPPRPSPWSPRTTPSQHQGGIDA